MEAEERAKKDIEKLEQLIIFFKKEKLNEKYPKVFEYAQNYANDSKHFFDKADFFSAFGAANYAYGFLDSVLLIENKEKVL
jgi:hypothetical protein